VQVRAELLLHAEILSSPCVPPMHRGTQASPS
jgi:hypothetical protein